MEKIPTRYINTSQKNLAPAESFSIRKIETLLAGQDMLQELHRHDFFYMLLLKKGTGKHDIDFTPYAIGNNSVFFMRPGQVHSLLLKAGSTGYLMQFKQEVYNPQDEASKLLLRKAGSINYYQLNDQRIQKLLSMLAHIFQEYQGKRERYQEVIKANMSMLFIELIREHHAPSPDSASLYIQARLEEFLELLETNIFNQKRVSHYAAILHLSNYQLNAITRSARGKTSSEIIHEHIILEAKRYLLGTYYQVSEISDQLGYEDVSYFIRFFKKHTGFSPNEFRNNFK